MMSRSMQEPTFLVCGEALMDVFAAGETPQGVSLDARVGGSPLNVAIGLARLAQPVAFLGALGSGFLGERLHQAMAKEGVNMRWVRRVDAPTTLGLVGLAADGSAAYSFYGADGADRQLRTGDLPELTAATRAILLGSYALVVEPIASALAHLVEREHRSRVISYDPNPRLNVEPDIRRWRERLDWMASRVHLIKVSDEDLQNLYPGADPIELTARWLKAGVRMVLITRGAQGASVHTERHDFASRGSDIRLVDTVGAGDTFQAAALAWLAEQRLLEPEALADITREQLAALLSFAISAADITCSRRGADLPRRHELGG